MQTLTSELLAAQTALGMTPYVKAYAYNDAINFASIGSTGFTPPTHETLLTCDSCTMFSPTLGTGILTVVATFNSSSNQFNIYYRFVAESGYSTASNWTTFTLLKSITGANNLVLSGLSVTSDNYQNTSSDYFCLGIQYLSADGSFNFYTNVVGVVYKFTAGPTVTTISTSTVTDMYAPFSLILFSIFIFYLSSFVNYGVAAHYDSVLGTGIVFFMENWNQAGSSSSNYTFQGNYKLKYMTINGGVSGLGTDGNFYILPMQNMGLPGRISTIQQNGTYYGVSVVYKQEIPGNALEFWELSGKGFSILPFTVTGPQDVSNSSSSVIYGPSDVKLTLCNLAFDQSSYPTLQQCFVISYVYQGFGVTFSESLQSTDFIHWGTRRSFNPSSGIYYGLFNTDSYYLVLQNNDQDILYLNRSVTTTDISAYLLSVSVQKNPDLSPTALILKLANVFIGTGATLPNTIIGDGLIKLQLGYNTSMGNEAVTDGWYYVDTIKQTTSVLDNVVEVDCRDGLKLATLPGYAYEIDMIGEDQIFFGGVTDQLYDTDFSILTGSWTHVSGGSIQSILDAGAPAENVLTLQQAVDSSFIISVDLGVGSQAGLGQNMSGYMTLGISFDIIGTGVSSPSTQYAGVYLNGWTQVSGNIYSVSAVVVTGPGSISRPVTFNSIPITLDVTQKFTLKIKRWGCYIWIYVNNVLCTFPTYYSDLNLPSTYRTVPWITGAYIFDNQSTYAYYTDTLGLFAGWNNVSTPPTGSSTPVMTFSNIHITSYKYNRTVEFNISDISQLAGIPSVILPTLTNETFADLSNWQ